MAIAIDCPHCKTNKVETANEVWHIKGFLLVSMHGSKTIIGCRSCVRSKTLSSMAVSSLMGWWCFPWGLGTPFVLVQNIVAAAGTDDPGPLKRLLSSKGMDYDELEIGEDGRSNGDVRLVNAMLGALHGMIWADGSADEREIEVGATILVAMLGDAMLPLPLAMKVLARADKPPAGDLGLLSGDGQLILMKAACAVAAADEVIEPSELDALRRLGKSLGLHPDVIESFVVALSAPEGTPVDEESLARKSIAASVLGVPVDAPVGMVRNAFTSKTMEASHEEDEAERDRQTAILQAAYEEMLAA